jgi:intracellular septation protein
LVPPVPSRRGENHEEHIRSWKAAASRHGGDAVFYLLTHNLALSIVLGMALGAAQIGWLLARRKPIDTMQWMSLFLVLGAGTVALITDDPRFVMIKPSVIYIIVGVVMLKRGWMNRYLPPIAIELVPDIAVISATSGRA